MYAPENKEELFTHLDNDFNSALDRNEQNDVWMSCIDQCFGTNPRLAEKIGDDHQALWKEYIEDRLERGIKADYD